MNKISLDELRPLWEQEGIHGSWRAVLKKDYDPAELYFEFGLMPESNRQRGDYRIVLDHEVHVWLCPADIDFRGEYVIRPDSSRAGQRVVDAAHQYHTFFVSDEEYQGMLKDAAHIYAEYQDENIVCFWSIPNKWFGDLGLVEFLSNHIVLSADYKNRIRTRASMYWP